MYLSVCVCACMYSVCMHVCSVCLCICVCVCMHACMGQGAQKRALEPLELELQTAVSLLTCRVLGAWELNSVPLQERHVFVTPDPFLQVFNYSL